MNTKILTAVVSIFLPMNIVLAQEIGELKNVNSIIERLVSIGDVIIYLLIAFAVVYMVYYIVIYFIKPSEESRKESGMRIFWGLVGLFLIVSIWGLVNILINTFGSDNRAPKDKFPYPSQFTGEINKSGN